MERLYLQAITKEDLVIYNNISDNDISTILEVVNIMNKEDLNKKNFQCFEYIDSGFFGAVYKYKNYAIKIFNRCQDNDDAENLYAVQDLVSYPKLYLSHKKFMVSEFISGNTLSKCSEDTMYSLSENTLKVFFNDLKYILQNGIFPSDLSEDNIILSQEGILKIIDVGCYDTLYIKGSKHEYNYLKEYEVNLKNMSLEDKLIKDFCSERAKKKLCLIGSNVLFKTA